MLIYKPFSLNAGVKSMKEKRYEDVYSEEELDCGVEDDILNGDEEGFMTGYLAG